MTELSQTDYAAARGWSAAYVTKLKRGGRLVITPAGKVNVEATDRLIAATRDPARGGDRRPGVAEAAPAAENHAGAGAGKGTGPRGGSDGSYNAASTRERIAKARKAELELAELAGQLVRRDQVERVIFGLARQTMDKLLALPERLAGQLANETDAFKVASLIEAEVRVIANGMAAVSITNEQPAEEAA